MKFGILPPYRTGVTADPDWMGAFVRHAEALGFESVYVVEHVIVQAGYDENYPYAPSGRMPLPVDCAIPDPLELLAYLAGITERIVLGTGILVLPAHEPAMLAKRLATIDVLSKGRMRLGIGVGWQREELEAVGVDFGTRGARTDEAIEALQALWTQDEASYGGAFFSFDRVVSRPRPVQTGGIPIHVGGHSRAAARRAGRFGEGFQPLGLEGDELAARVAEMRSAAVDAGRDPDAIELSLGGLLDLCDDAALAAAEAAGAHRLVLSTRNGDLDETLAEMSAFAARALA